MKKMDECTGRNCIGKERRGKKSGGREEEVYCTQLRMGSGRRVVGCGRRLLRIKRETSYPKKLNCIVEYRFSIFISVEF